MDSRFTSNNEGLYMYEKQITANVFGVWIDIHI